VWSYIRYRLVRWGREIDDQAKIDTWTIGPNSPCAALHVWKAGWVPPLCSFNITRESNETKKEKHIYRHGWAEKPNVQIIQIRGNRNIQKSEPCPTKIVNQIDSWHVSCLNRAGGLPVRVVRRAVLLPLLRSRATMDRSLRPLAS
jgi:hypothetical protein